MAVSDALTVAVAAGATVSLMPLGRCERVWSTGLRWELDGGPLDLLAGPASRTSPKAERSKCGSRAGSSSCSCPWIPHVLESEPMQSKMAGSPRLTQAFYRLYFGFWIPVLVWASTWWPLSPHVLEGPRIVMLPFNLVRPKYLRAMQGNYARILGLPRPAPTVRRIAWRMGYEHAYHWIDFFRWSQLPLGSARDTSTRSRAKSISRRRAFAGAARCFSPPTWATPRSGAVAMGTHFEPVHVLYWRDRFATAEEFRARMRRAAMSTASRSTPRRSPWSRRCGSSRRAASSPRTATATSTTRAGRWSSSARRQASRPAPSSLPRVRRRSILPTFFLLPPNRRFTSIYEPPSTLDGADGARGTRPRRETTWVAILERRIRQYPEQWYCFYPFWERRAGRTSRARRGGDVPATTQRERP